MIGPGETVISYRLQLHPAGAAWPEWSDERRMRCFLDESIPRTLSVDGDVWWDAEEWFGLEFDDYPHFWTLAALMKASQVPPAGQALPVCVTAFDEFIGLRDYRFGEDSWLLSGMASDLTGFDPVDWELLGYDVADEYFAGGLSNAHYSAEEKSELAPAWAPKLNAHGLFTHAADAEAYRAITDLRVPGYAPFRVFGLYALRSALHTDADLSNSDPESDHLT